jgi:DNA-binding response OmpR family regulator
MASLNRPEDTAGIPEALIVEDSLAQAHIISRMIEAQGWACRHCPTLQEAYDVLSARKARGRTIQALFLDVFVGAYDALAHVTRMKTFTQGAPLILMTAGGGHEATETTLNRARQTAADFVLRKPFAPNHVCHRFLRPVSPYRGRLCHANMLWLSTVMPG